MLDSFWHSCLFNIGRCPMLMFGYLHGSGSWNGLLKSDRVLKKSMDAIRDWSLAVFSVVACQFL